MLMRYTFITKRMVGRNNCAILPVVRFVILNWSYIVSKYINPETIPQLYATCHAISKEIYAFLKGAGTNNWDNTTNAFSAAGICYYSVSPLLNNVDVEDIADQIPDPGVARSLIQAWGRLEDVAEDTSWYVWIDEMGFNWEFDDNGVFHGDDLPDDYIDLVISENPEVSSKQAYEEFLDIAKPTVILSVEYARPVANILGGIADLLIPYL